MKRPPFVMRKQTGYVFKEKIRRSFVCNQSGNFKEKGSSRISKSFPSSSDRECLARKSRAQKIKVRHSFCFNISCVIAEPLSFRIKQHSVVVVCIRVCLTVSNTGEAPCSVQSFSESSDSAEKVKKSNCSGYQPPFAAKKTVQISLHRFSLLVSVL